MRTAFALRGWLAAVLVPLALLGAASPAAATPSLDACHRIVTPDATTGQVVIDAPGTWCLDRDHAPVATASANKRFIQITSDDVVLDCRGHSITAAGTYSEPWAISANGRQRITVRNCTIRDFWLGMELDAATLEQGDFLVEDNVLIRNARAIGVNGTRTIVRRNRLYDSGDEVALVVSNGSAEVVDNVIDGVGPVPFAVWMNVSGHGEIRGNVIRGLSPGTDFSQNTSAIFISQGGSNIVPAPVTVRDNVLVGTQYNRAISCGPETRYTGNVIINFSHVAEGCTESGFNDVSP